MTKNIEGLGTSFEEKIVEKPELSKVEEVLTASSKLDIAELSTNITQIEEMDVDSSKATIERKTVALSKLEKLKQRAHDVLEVAKVCLKYKIPPQNINIKAPGLITFNEGAYKREGRYKYLDGEILCENQGPFFIDLGELPVVSSEKIQQVDALDIMTCPDGTIIGTDGINEANPAGSSHPDAVYTMQVLDTDEGRFLRVWRSHIDSQLDEERRLSRQGYGFFIKVEDFVGEHLNPTFTDTSSLGSTITYKSKLFMPYFREGKGPHELVSLYDPGDIYFSTVGRVFVQYP